jgi:AmmeMemoRadiSam system protein B
MASQPGLILRDPFRYTDSVLLIPPPLVRALACFDGLQTEAELGLMFKRIGGGQLGPEDARRFHHTLRTNGFLESKEHEAMKAARHAEFRRALGRTPAHAGSAYPETSPELIATLDGYHQAFDAKGLPPKNGPIRALAAPHVSPSGGAASYAAAYRRLTPELADRTFVILGTSHYGEPDRFGLATKGYQTPLGTAEVEQSLVERLSRAAPKAVIEEDYCHAVEHSIEFQVVFLQHAVSPKVRIVPILCGPYAAPAIRGKPPESNPEVARFFDALRELTEREGDRLFFVLGVDLAHIGTRYGDTGAVRANQGRMLEVEREDREGLTHICRGEREAYLEHMIEKNGDLKWCGFPPFYAFLKAMPTAQGRLLHYEQWNIDPESVVSFAGIEFH